MGKIKIGIYLRSCCEVYKTKSCFAAKYRKIKWNKLCKEKAHHRRTQRRGMLPKLYSVNKIINKIYLVEILINLQFHLPKWIFTTLFISHLLYHTVYNPIANKWSNNYRIKNWLTSWAYNAIRPTVTAKNETLPPFAQYLKKDRIFSEQSTDWLWGQTFLWWHYELKTHYLFYQLYNSKWNCYF